MQTLQTRLLQPIHRTKWIYSVILLVNGCLVFWWTWLLEEGFMGSGPPMKFLVGNVHLARWPTLNKALSLPRSSHRKPFLWNYSTHVIRQFSTSGKCCAPHERNVLKTRVPTVKAFGFRELGIHDVVSSSLETAYPDVKRPTLSQADFIPAILQGKDVLLHDATGTGKYVAICLRYSSKLTCIK